MGGQRYGRGGANNALNKTRTNLTFATNNRNMSLPTLKSSFLAIALLSLMLGFSSCGSSEAATDNNRSATEQSSTTEEGNPAADDNQEEDTEENDQVLSKKKPNQPQPEINADQAFARLEAVIDLTDEQRTQIEGVYADLTLPEEPTLMDIQNRNRELRERVYNNILTDAQRETIRAARRNRSGN